MKLSYRNDNGVVALVLGAPKPTIERFLGRELTDEEYREIVAKGVPEGAAEVQELPEDWQPVEDRTFRNAWEIDGKGVSVHMGKARDIHRNSLRRLREAEFAKLDVDSIRAQEKGDKAELAKVAERKQKLRDAPAHPLIEAAATPEELKAITLEQVAT
jgi:hypothetical protein